MEMLLLYMCICYFFYLQNTVFEQVHVTAASSHLLRPAITRKLKCYHVSSVKQQAEDFKTEVILSIK